MTPHEEILLRAAQEATAREARSYDQMERLTNQMLDARKAAKHLRSCMIRMMVVIAEHRDPQLFDNVMGCLIQDDLSCMAFDFDEDA